MIGITWISTNFSVFFYFRLFLYFLGKSGLTFDVFKAGIRMSFLKQIQEKLIAGQFPLMWFKKISVLSSWSFTRVMCLDWILVCASSVFYSSFFFIAFLKSTNTAAISDARFPSGVTSPKRWHMRTASGFTLKAATGSGAVDCGGLDGGEQRWQGCAGLKPEGGRTQDLWDRWSAGICVRESRWTHVALRIRI